MSNSTTAISSGRHWVRVLLVDDRAENLLALERILEPLALTLVKAHSGEEALKALLDEEFAIILLDIRMPGLDGLQTAAAIKQRERTRHTPIIFLTAVDSPDDIAKAYEHGAADFLIKPFNGPILRAKVSVFAELFRRGEQIRQTEQLEAERRRSQAERARLLAQETKARQQAEAASLAKDEFLATASHELRTPLHAILGWARLMRSEDIDPNEYRHGIEVIERNAATQVRMIEDMLDGARIITGKLRLESRSIELSSIIRAAVDTVQPVADSKEIQLRCMVDPTVGRVLGDPVRLQQVAWNLVNNAIKFTPRRGQVEVRLERSGAVIQLKVSDTGQGISQDFLPYVFDRFRQEEGSTTRRHGGLGLGLALVRHLVEAHGGSVRAESRGLGNGATFIITLPIPAVCEDDVAPSPPDAGMAMNPLRPSTAGALDGVSVLVVDDEADARELVAILLQSKGAEVTTAASVEHALAALEQSTPTVLVSDIGMPGGDGYDLMRRVADWGAKRGVTIPAVALTAYAGEVDRLRALAAGFQVHAAKPIAPSELISIVADLAATTRHGGKSAS